MTPLEEMTPLEYAVEYAKKGWYVFPVHSVKNGKCSCGKLKCTGKNRGKHPRTENGLKDATLDLGVIESWFTTWPDANIGIVTGEVSGFWVLDVDDGGDETLADIEHDNGQRPDTPEQHTGGGGLHILYKWTEHVHNATKFLPGLDVKGDGGYIVAAPSSHVKGYYDWDGLLDMDTELAEAPKWLTGILKHRAKSKRTIGSDPKGILDGIAEGERNQALFDYGTDRAKAGALDADIEMSLRLAARNTKPPLPDDEVERTIKSVLDYRLSLKDPIPLTLPTGIMPFPTEALDVADPILTEYVTDVAEVRQAPLDLAGMILLTVLATCTQRRVRVQVGESFSVWTNCFVTVALPPGSRKSGVFNDMRHPITLIEKRLRDRVEPMVQRSKDEYKADEGRLAIIEKKLPKANGSGDRENLLAEMAAIRETMVEPLAMPSLWASGDSSLETLARDLNEQGERLTLFDDEGGVFNIMAGLYSGGNGLANIDIFLKSWDGGSHRVRRMSREDLNLEAPVMSIGLCVQPDVIQSLSEHRHFRGRGLLGRFLYAIPEPLVGTRMFHERGLRPDIADNYEKLICELFEATDPSDVVTLELSGEALRLWAVYADNVERMQSAGGKLDHITDWGSKLAGEVAGIIGNLHCVRYRSGDPSAIPIEVETVLAGWAIGEYLIGHALKAFGVMLEPPEVSLSKKIMLWVKDKKLEAFSMRDLQRKFRMIGRQQEFYPALGILVERGLLARGEEEKGTRSSGKKPSMQYLVSKEPES